MKILFNKSDRLNGVWFHIAGIACIIWFLVRVLPKPDRIRYPCQQMSITVAMGYVTFWSVLFCGLGLWIKRVKSKTVATTSAFLAILIILFSVSVPIFANNNSYLFSATERWDPIPNEPIGTPQGVNPGRVVWVWDPDCTDWDGSNYWWYSSHNDQNVLDEMFSKGIQTLAGESTDYNAWDALFKHFNLEHGYGNVGYQTGEKICIKINMNSDNYGYGYQHNYINSNPYVIKSLFRDLVNVVGVAQEDITVYDASRYLANWWWDRATDEFPNIKGVDKNGGASGRTKYVGSSSYIHFTDGQSFALPTCLANAKYFINVPCTKMHGAGRVTLAGKNLFGAWNPNVANMHTYMEYGEAAMGNAAPQADLLLHEELGGKTLLALGDGTWGCREYNYNIERFQMYPFNNDWMSSLFFSQDTVALDSVMYDFLWVERNGYPWEGAQNYIHEVADPPIGRYDPEGDGTYVSESLGVHEHWNTSIDIFSSDRYLGPSGNGIDYIYYNISNEPPETPSDPDPSDGATDVDINADLSWNCSDPDGDDLTYDMYFEANDPTPDELVSNNQSETTYDPGTMNYDTHYYWQIVAWDEHGVSTSGSVWDFTTGSEHNDPPYVPSNPDPENGSTDIDIDADLSWTSGDPDPEDTIVYDVYLEANDPTPDNKVADDMSETTFDPETLDYETVYYWRIIAKDNHGASTWGPVWHFTTETAPVPDLDCEGDLSWTDVKPQGTAKGNFTVRNIGEPFSLLNWEIESYPEWGTWTFLPDEGLYLTPEDGHVTVNVSVATPEEENTEYTGTIKIINVLDPSDYCEISVSLTTPKNKAFNFNIYLLEQLFEQFLNALQILKYLVGL